jgi:ADP-ribose pyrophosphatase
MSDLPETVTSSTVIFEGRVVRKLRVDEVRLANGKPGRREVVEHGGAVAIVPVDDSGRVLLVRQYRHATGRTLLEIPAGGLEAGEAPETTAQRELQEETGFRAGRIGRLGGFFLAPGYSSEYLHVFLAEGLSEDGLDSDEDEDIALEALDLQSALRLIDAGGIEDAKSVAGLLLYARRIATSPHADLVAGDGSER